MGTFTKKGNKNIVTKKGKKYYQKRGPQKTVTKDSNKRQIPEEVQAPPKFSPLGAEIIKEFEQINPAVKRLYNNTTQRKACDDLLEEYGLEKVVKVIHFLPRSNRIAYLPTITTPLQLWDSWAKLEAGLVKKSGEQITKGRGLA